MCKRTAAALLMITAMGHVQADEIQDLIAAGKSAYQAEEFLTAATHLESAAQLIRDQMGLSFVDLLPQPLSGWSAGEPNTTANALTVTQTTRLYTHDATGARIRAELTASEALAQGFAVMSEPELTRDAFVLAWELDGAPTDAVYEVHVTGADLMTPLAAVNDLKENQWQIADQKLADQPSGSVLYWRVTVLNPDGTKKTSSTFTTKIK